MQYVKDALPDLAGNLVDDGMTLIIGIGHDQGRTWRPSCIDRGTRLADKAEIEARAIGQRDPVEGQCCEAVAGEGTA